MSSLFSRARVGIAAAALLAFSVPLLTPKPAEAWWYRGGPGWHYGFRGCCYGPGIVVGLPGPIVVAPRPYYAYGPRPWVRAHWNGPYWVPSHWG